MREGKKRRLRLLLLVSVTLLVVALVPSNVAGQTATGQINMTILDQTGGVIPGAEIRVLGSKTGNVARSLVTDDSGNAVAALLKPDNYDVEVMMQGFQKHVQSGVVVQVGDSLRLRVTLKPGQITEQVTVVGETPLLKETTHDLGQVVDEEEIMKLPLNGRNYLQLGSLTAGTVPNERSRDKTYSAFGNRGLQNAFILDGARNVNYLRGLDNRQRDAMRPSLEAISEFKVQTSNFSAEYGASAGAVINVVTKSGTNEFHGSLFEYHRNSALDARDFFAPPGEEKPLLVRHQYGGSFGGPLVRDRAWFMSSFERTHISEETSLTATVPTPEQKQGIFNEDIFNPFSTRANPDGGGFVRDQFLNNTVPSSLFDPIGKLLVDRYPDPNIDRAANNYVQSPLQATRVNNATFRGDVQVTDNDLMFGRFGFNLGDVQGLPALPEPAQQGAIRNNDSWSLGYGYTRTFSAAIVNELRFGWNRVEVDQDGTMPRDEIVANSLDPRVTSGSPTFNISGFTGLNGAPAGLGNLPLVKSSGVWNLSDNISWLSGDHTFKFGFDYQAIRVTTFATLQGRGSFAFDRSFTQNPQSRTGTGNALADLLMGIPHSYNTGTNAEAVERAHNFYWYFQDDWRVGSNLTINLGLRYELTRPFWETENRLANFILEPDSPDFGTLVFAGNPEYPRSLLETDRNNFAPRVGFAYKHPGSGMVIRGGYGIFFMQDEGSGVAARLTNNPPFFGFGAQTVSSDRNFISSTIHLSDGLPARQPIPGPDEFEFLPSQTAQLRSWDPRWTMGYSQQWNLTLQKQLVKDLMFETSYVGNHGVGLWARFEANQPAPGPGAVNNRRPYWPDYTRARIMRSAPWASSTYHGISTRLQKRFTDGYSYLVAYTFGRSIDTASSFEVCDGCGASGDYSYQNNRPDGLIAGAKGPSNHNVPHRFVASGIWELPFGVGRKRVTEGPLAYLVGGWDMTAIVTLQDGIPITPQMAFDSANAGTLTRPDRLADGKLDDPSPDRYFDIDAFAAPSEYTFGNAGRNILEAPGTANVDYAVHRNFSFGDGKRIEFRAEAFNLFNRTQFGMPGLALGNSTAGVIGSTKAPNRQWQLGLKFIF